MKTTVKFTYIALICAIMLGCLPLGIGAEISEGLTGATPGPECFTYRLNDDGTATITSYSGSGNAVAIPDELDGYKVTVIANEVFKNHKEITRIDFGASLLSIGDHAFEGCTALEVAILPTTLRYIGTGAFESCTSLYHIDFGSSLLDIGVSAFVNCDSLDSIFLPEALESVGNMAFTGCDSLRQVVVASTSARFGSAVFSEIPNITVYAPAGASALSIGDVKTATAALADSLTVESVLGGIEITAFKSGAKAVIVPEYIGSKRVVSIADGAFANRTALEAVYLPDSIRTIGKSAFENDRALGYIRLPRTLSNSISAQTFMGCSSLRRVYLPEGVEGIGISAFSGCSALTAVTFPESFSYLQSSAFYGASALRALIFWGDEPECSYKNSTPDIVSLGSAPESMKIYIDSARTWPRGAWYPNGKSGFVGFSVTARKYNCFFVEHMDVFASCAVEGKSTFTCAFCGESHSKTYPVTEHNYVSVSVSEDTETFRCTGCVSNYTLGLLSASTATVTAETSAAASGVDIIKSVTVTYRGKTLTYGVDYTYELEHIKESNRVELTVTGKGEYGGSQTVGYSTLDGRLLKTYTLTVIGESGSGTYFRDDIVTLIPDPPIPEGMEAVWTADGGKLLSAENDKAMLEMPAKDVTVILTSQKAPETTPPVTTEPSSPVTTPIETDPPVTTPEQTTPPATTPADTTTEREPFSSTPGAHQYLTRAMLWAVLLFVSFAAFIVLCIMMFHSEKKNKSKDKK